ncbi:MAG: FHA domain-containing protein [Rikenellaceae bacterium]
MELTIGREPGSSRLSITIDGNRVAIYGDAYSVPQSVSREHCKITIIDGIYKIKNVKVNNFTFVNGRAIVQSVFAPDTDVITLGSEQYVLDVNKILIALNLKKTANQPQQASQRPQQPAQQPAQQQQPQVETFSISFLEDVWENHHQTKLNIQIKEKKFNALRSVTGLFSMGAIACGFIPGLAEYDVLRVALYALGFILLIYFFVISYMSSSKTPVKMAELDKEFRNDYVCPNPKCGRFLGNQPYDVIARMPTCPYCRSKFKHD